jgi:hypothetical protein
LQHVGGELSRDRPQLNSGRQLDPDIRVKLGAGRLALERLIDGAALIVRERLEGIGNR